MGTCARCVLPDHYPNIRFTEVGICNFCTGHRSTSYAGKDALVRAIKKRKNPESPYDAILSLSGGRDSSFAAYYAVHELGLKIMGFTYDNGFMPKTTWDNIHNTVKILGIDHTICSSNHVKSSVHTILSGLTRKPSPAMVAFLCSGCQTGISQERDRLSLNLNCRVILTGGGEPENTFAEYLLSGSSARNKSNLVRGFLRELIANIYYLRPVVLASFFQEYWYRFVDRPKKTISLPLFRYIEWDEDQILTTITRELNWRIPEKMSTSWRADCKVNVIKQYLYREMLGFTKNDELLSQLIRNGAITRSEALARLEKENAINLELLSEIFTEIGIPVDRMYQALAKRKMKIT